MLSKYNVKCVSRLLRQLSTTTKHARYLSSVQEYTKKPKYPPIEDLSEVAVKRREKLALHEKYRKLNTVEEKLFALNLLKYWGWDTTVLKEGEIPYDLLPFAKYITRTHFNITESLPLPNKIDDSELDNLVNLIRPQLQNAILFELQEKRHQHELRAPEKALSEAEIADVKTKSLLEQINRILLVNLGQYAEHIFEAEVDYEPRLEAFWKVGGFKQSIDEHARRTEKLERDDIPWEGYGDKDYADRLVEHWFQYFGSVVLQLRTNLPLAPISEELVAPDVDLSKIIGPDSCYSPAFYGFGEKKRFGTTVPGFWPGSENEFSLLSFHSRNHLLGRPPHFNEDEHADALHSQAVLAGYASCHGQASYQGFSTFNEVTYPLASQHVITDGRLFSFYAYQLNTTLMHEEFVDTNPRVNLCYGTPALKLYEELKGSEFSGWNDDTLKTLISLYMNKPAERDHELKPFVNPKESFIKDITDIDERRVWLHNEFRFMYSNRPRHQLPYEIFDWEWIYKIKFMTRPMEKRFRPFEVWEDPTTHRTYRDYLPKYIPKHMRYPHNPRQENYNTYFPDAFPDPKNKLKK